MSDFFPIAYYQNDYSSLADISIGATDLGVHRGYSVFDFFKIKKKSSPYIDDYLERLFRSCRLCQIDIKKDKTRIKQIIQDLLTQNQTSDAYIKVIASAGDSVNGFDHQNQASLLVLAMPIHPIKPSYYTQGAKLLTCAYKRDMPAVKTTNYLNAAMQTDRLKEQGAIDLLYHDQGWIREASRCNIFLVLNGQLYTPATDILPGITRKRVLSTDIGIKHHVEDLPTTALRRAEEVFITSTTKGVMPITHIDDSTISNGRIGPYSRAYMSLINQF